MPKRKRVSWFRIINGAFLIAVAIVCLLPFVYIAAVSFSSSTAASAGMVGLWPVGFNVNSYKYVAGRADFWRAAYVSTMRVLVGLPVTMVLTILMAYPLSRETASFRSRTFYVWFLFITMLFSGGLIPGYMVVRSLGLLNSFWVLILPVAVQAFNIVLLLNFFRQLPKELDEAARLDGAGHWRILWTIYVPTTTPALATLALFTFLTHWNSWFDGLIFMSRPENYPLQSYLRTILIDPVVLQSSGDWQVMASISDRTVKAAQILIAALPIMAVYPFLQKYFVKGIVIGSVKG
jgi:putative aldouronate transport system permease protein